MFACLRMRMNVSRGPNALLLDIVDREINALILKAKDLRRIQQDETGRNWL